MCGVLGLVECSLNGLLFDFFLFRRFLKCGKGAEKLFRDWKSSLERLLIRSALYYVAHLDLE